MTGERGPGSKHGVSVPLWGATPEEGGDPVSTALGQQWGRGDSSLMMEPRACRDSRTSRESCGPAPSEKF